MFEIRSFVEKNIPITKSQSVSESCKGHALVPSALAGAAQLQATVNPSCWSAAEMLNHHWITHETSQVSTLVYPSSLSGSTQRLLNTQRVGQYTVCLLFLMKKELFLKKWRKKYCELYLEAFFVNKLGECNIYVCWHNKSKYIFLYETACIVHFFEYPGQSFEVLCMYCTLSQKPCKVTSMYKMNAHLSMYPLRSHRFV